MKLHTVNNKCVVYSTLCSPSFTPVISRCITTFAALLLFVFQHLRTRLGQVTEALASINVLVLLLSPAYSGFREEGSRAFRSVQYNFVSTRPIVIPTIAHLTSTSNRDSRSKCLVFAIAMSGKASPKKRFAASLIQCHAMDPWKQKVAFDERRP